MGARETRKSSALVVTSAEAAALLGMSPRTLANWRSRGEGPPYAHLTNSTRSQVVYRTCDIEAWLNERFSS